MWWQEIVTEVSRSNVWPVGREDPGQTIWHVDGGPRFGLFGPQWRVVEVRDASSGLLLGSVLLDESRRALVAVRVGPRRFVPVWKLQRGALWLATLPIRLVARVMLRLGEGVARASEELLCLTLRSGHVSDEERERMLEELPPDVRKRVSRRCS